MTTQKIVLATRFFAPELCHGTARKRLPPKIRGGGAPNDAGRGSVPKIRASTPKWLSVRRAPRMVSRYREAPVTGRARLSALRRDTRQALRLAQLRPALTGICSGSRRHNPFY